MKETTGRISFYDNLKFILILLVVIGHLLQYQLDSSYAKGIFLFIYSFHMPLFIFVTGFFAKKIISGPADKRMNKIISYLLIYLIFKILILLFQRFVIRQPYSLSLLVVDDSPWYLLATIIWIILVTITKTIKPRYMFIFSVICCLFIGYESNITDQFALSRVFVFFPFFLLGYYLTSNQLISFINKLHEKKINIILALIILAAIFTLFMLFGNELYFVRGLLTARNPYVSLEIPFNIPLAGMFLRLIWIIYNIFIAIIIFTLIPRRKLFITKLGSRTLQVYVLQYFVTHILNYSFISVMLKNIFGDYIVFALILLGIIITLILSLKIFGKPVNKIMSLNYQKLYKTT